jgi:CheY-like chemotaxis protein
MPILTLTSLRGNEMRIFLVVDDHPGDLEQTAAQLKTLSVGAEILTAPSGEAGLEMLHTRRVMPSLVFLDFDLGDAMSGIEFLGRVRQTRWLDRVPIAMLSEPVADRFVVTSYRLGVCAFLTKPVRGYELREAIRDFAQPAKRMTSATVIPGDRGPAWGRSAA